MSQRREIEARLALYDELSGILGAMRSFALAELHRITRREQAQHQVLEALESALQKVAAFLPSPASGASLPPSDIWLLLGSVRGFCGSFNDDIIHAWRAAEGARVATIVVGERLAAAMPVATEFLPVAGAESGLDAAATIDRILAALAKIRRDVGESAGVIVCVHGDDGVGTQRLLPLPSATPGPGLPPVMNEPPGRVAASVAEHYLFHALLAALLHSIRVENRKRLIQMESALRHIDQGSQDLARQRNRLRQEEIVEEIEVMTGLRRPKPSTSR